MFSKFYEFFITQKMASVDLFDCLATAKEYGKVYANGKGLFSYVGEDIYALKHSEEIDGGNEGEPVFIQIDGREDLHCTFYKNLMFVFSDENGDKIVRVYAKRPQDEWSFLKPSDGQQFDIMNPVNVRAEVYINYDVNVLKLDRCCGEDYRSGEWNKMFYRSIHGFIDTVQGYTEVNRLKKAYKK